MDTTVAYKIMTFFDNIDDMLNNFIDRMELTPVQITTNLYITGFKRSQTDYTSLDVHIKEIKKVKLNNIHASITDEGGWYMMEPDNEMWLNCSVLNEKLLQTALDKFITTFGNLNTFHIMLTKWKDDNDSFPHVEVALFENKRVACKEALAMRKKHKNVTTKFEMYNKQGELIDKNAIHEPTDFELVTAKVD